MIGKLSYDEIEEVLRTNIWGRIGCNDGDKTYIVPVSYVYDGKSIIAHSMEGLKITMMRTNPKVCFEVDEIKNFNHWKSVIVWGEYQELKTERDRQSAMKLFTGNMIPVKTSKASLHQHIAPKAGYPDLHETTRPVIYRIMIVHSTGRFEKE